MERIKRIGGEGHDNMSGDGPADYMLADAGTDIMNGGNGSDQILGSNRNYNIFGGYGADENNWRGRS